MVAVCEGMTPVSKLDLLLCLVLGKGASVASEVEDSKWSYARSFLGEGQVFVVCPRELLDVSSRYKGISTL